MKPKTIFIIAFFLGLLVSFNAYGFEVTAYVDKNQITRDDSILLRVEVQSKKAQLDLSAIKDFKVVSRGSSSLTQITNGKLERKMTYQYVLMPLREGNLSIPPIKATSKGKEAFTDPIKILVTKTAEDPGVTKKIFATAKVVQTNLFAGQQTVYSLKFYTSVRLSGLGFETAPQFDGFFVKPFEKERTTTQRINGVLYQVTQVDYLIIPSTAGSLTIDPITLVANVVVKSNRAPRFDSFFNDSFFSNQQTKPTRVTSNPVTLTVQPLPPSNKDENSGDKRFSGLIGRFEIETDVDKSTLKAGESLTWTLKISGSGNIMDAGLPKIDLTGTDFKVYDDNPTESIRLTPTGYEGFKLFKKAIVPVNPGRFTLPKVELTYFDVDQKAYHTIASQPIVLDVTPSEKMHVAAVTLPENSNSAPVKKTVALINKDILEIKEGLDVLKDHQQMRPLFFGICLLIPAFLFAGVKVFSLAQKKEISIAKQMEQKARQHLKKASKCDIKDDAFLSQLYSALVSMILSKGRKKAETVTLDEAKKILADADVEKDDIRMITELLVSIESVRFGQKKLDETKARLFLAHAKEAMKLICFAMIVFGLSTITPATVLATPSTQYLEAIQNYKAGEFKTAAIQFESLARTPVNNPSLFYNIGNAYLKSGDIGRAVLWYERAKQLAPNDPDLKFNLAYAESQLKDKTEETVSMMDIFFFWDSLIRIKTLQITAIFLAVAFFGWAGFRTIKQRPVFSGTGLLIAAIFILVTGLTSVAMFRQTSQQHAIILEKQVNVRSGVLETATRLFELHAGTRVRVEEKRDDYIKIFFAKGKVGWVKADSVEII